MKQSNSKEKILPEDIAITQGTTSTDFTKQNKGKFLQTITSNFSNQTNNTKQHFFSRNKNNKTNKFLSPFKTEENIHKYPKTISKTTRASIIPINTENSFKKSNKIMTKSSLIQNLLLPRNINSYTHLIRGKGVGIFAEIDWALRLRDYSHKNDETKVLDYKDYYYRKHYKQEQIKEEKENNKIQLTDNFSPPYFYEDDLKKYKTKKKKFEKSLIFKLNPNFNKIRHLLYRNKGDHSNKSQFHFATSLRDNIQNLKEKKIQKFEILPVVVKNNINNNFIPTFLAPCTKHGIQNLKKIEKYLRKKYDYKYKQEWVGGEKIQKKILSEDNRYTISGIGETLGDVKYDNYFKDNNMFSNKHIINTEANPVCKFELSLRTYGNDEDINRRTHKIFRPKKKK